MRSDRANLYPKRLIKNEAWRAGIFLSEDEISALAIQVKDSMRKQDLRFLIGKIKLNRNVKPH